MAAAAAAAGKLTMISINCRSPPPAAAASNNYGLATTKNQSYWDAINTHLKNSIPIRHPTCVFEPMHHLTFAASKSTAPLLCIAACELVGGSPEDAIAAASAIHLMHAAAFTHQHLITHDVDVVQHMYNPNIQLLTPDAMVPLGFELLGRSSHLDSHTILRLIIEISRAVGSQGLLDGLYQEMQSIQDENEMMIKYVCEKKEGELHACAGACGAILGGGTEEEIEKLRKFGLYVGMIQGLVGRKKHYHKLDQGRIIIKSEEIVKKFRDLALQQLQIFNNNGQNVEQISTLVEIISI